MPEINVLNRIQEFRRREMSKEAIYRQLIDDGVLVDEINAAFDKAGRERDGVATQKRTISIILTIGAILVAAGIFSFIASNWQMISRPVKVMVVLAAMLSVYAVAFLFDRKGKFPRTAGALWLLGALVYGGAIFLVAQIFNIRTQWPDGFLLWLLGCAFLALAVDSYLLLGFGALLGFIAAIGHPFSIMEFYSGSTILTTSSWLLGSVMVIAFALGLRERKRFPAEQKDFY